MCFNDLKKRKNATAISGVKAKNMAFSSRNHLKIRENVGNPLGNPISSAFHVSEIYTWQLDSKDLWMFDIAWRFLPIHWGLAVLNGGFPLINCPKWSLSRIRVEISYTKPTLSVTLWSSRRLRGLRTFCGTTMDEWLSKVWHGKGAHPSKVWCIKPWIMYLKNLNGAYTNQRLMMQKSEMKQSTNQWIYTRHDIYEYVRTVWPEQTASNSWTPLTCTLMNLCNDFKDPTEHQQWRQSGKGLPAQVWKRFEASWLVKRLTQDFKMLSNVTNLL